MFSRTVGHRCVPCSTLGFEVRRLVERLEPDQPGNEFDDGHAGVAEAELGHRLGRQFEERHYQPPERSAVADNHYVSPRPGEVRLLDEFPASFDDVSQEFAARGLERRVAGEIPADPRAVFDLQIGPCLAFPLAKTDLAERRSALKRHIKGVGGLNAPCEVAGPNTG